MIIKLRFYNYFANEFNSYIESLSPRKQDKALIDLTKAKKIESVLLNPKNMELGTPQFR